jgi:phosphoribosylformylglycinamidine synthase
MPIAHGDGRFVAPTGVLDELEAEGRVIFRYADAGGNTGADANPNGSERNIAGIVSEGGNVLGMMPHPERACSPLLGSSDGVRLLESILTRVAA